MNILDPISATDVNRSIMMFANGGNVMPEDVRSDLNEFRSELAKDDLPAETRKVLESAVSNILSKYDDPDGSAQATTDDLPRTIKPFVSGNWYADNPDKLLGDLVVDKDRYGNEIKVLKGDVSVLSHIDVQSNLLELAGAINIGVSIETAPIEEVVKKPEVVDFVSEIIEKSNTSIGKKAVRKKIVQDSVSSDEVGSTVAPIQTFEEIYNSLNKNISQEELRAYLWYKNSIGQKLSDEWYMIAYPDQFFMPDEAQVKKWVRDGVLFYFNGELLPLPLYTSGNIYEKISRVVKSGDNSGQDIEHIESTYGVDAVRNHIEALNASFQRVQSQKLIITGAEDENSLILKPTSKFARSFAITHSNSFEELKWWSSGRKDTKGQPDFDKAYGREYQKTEFESLSLTEVFQLWLIKNAHTIDFRGNITYNDIIYFHIQKRTKQAPSELSDFQLKEWKANLERTKANAAAEGNRLFLRFLAEELTAEQKIAVESQWNASFNNYLQPDYEKIPVAFNIARSFFGEEPFIVKPEKRDAVSFIFNEGSGCLAYDVGVGKSLSAIMIIEQFLVAGYCKRPFLVVPNQTYKQWLSEIRNALPHRKVNGLFNLGTDYIEEVMDENQSIQMVDPGSISVMTYEGFTRLGFNDITQSELMSSLYDILNQGGADEKMSDKKRASFYEKLEGLVGRGLKGTNVEIESLGLDFVCYDEAHALKKVFTSTKGEQEDGDKKSKKQYNVQSGAPSDTALKGFMISHYILKQNNWRNVLLLTATPFTNSPLEVFSMLSLVAYHHLEKLGIVNINDFFDNYIDVRSELTINHKLQPQYKQVVKGFNNLTSLQKIIFRFFNYKDGEDVGVIRPNKIVIPYVKKLVDGNVIPLDKDEQVTCNIEMTPIQKSYMDDVIRYAEGGADLIYENAQIEEEEEEEEEDVKKKSKKNKKDDAEAVSYEALSESEKAGVRALRAMNFSRNIALSPYLYEYNSLGKPTPERYINSSPKLQYVIECIRSVKEYHEKHNEPVSGQVIYMDRGLKYFGLIRKYLVEQVGFLPHEVAEITAKMTTDKKRLVQDAFLGRKYNEATKEYEKISDAERVKVLIGSSSIKEGMNLQKKSTVLYNCFIDWNPTDVIQLQGRIWRQQNEFANVRIVNPLVIDSIDIFMFQKLEEKTARINTIWSNNGKSVFKLDEINPEEVKYSLIKDPKIIAGIEVETKTIKLQDEINSIRAIDQRLQEVHEAITTMIYKEKDINELLKEFAPSKIEGDISSKLNYLNNIYKTDTPKDDQGRVMVSYYENRTAKAREIEAEGGVLSPHQLPYRPYWLTDLLTKKRLVEKEVKDLLTPRNIPLDADVIKMYRNDTDMKIKDIEKQIEFLKSKEFVENRTKEIVEYRERTKFEIKPVSRLVSEFERLNYLLSIKMQTPSKKAEPVVTYESCEVLDENGERKIDPDTIAKLSKCVNSLPQTKDLNVNEAGEYTEQRKAMHDKIINDFKAGLTCIAQEDPIAILTGGSPASGKSTFLRKYAPYLLGSGLVHVDADEIRAKLPEYKGWNASATHLETKDIVNRILSDEEVGIPCNYDLIYDGTMNNTKNYLPLIGLLKRLGYRIFIVYMDNIPYNVVKQRMLERYKKSGRFVPIDVIDDFYSKGKQALFELKSKVDGYIVVDGSSQDYTILESGGLQIPMDRDYSKLGRPPAESEEKMKVQKEIEDLQGLSIFVEGSELDKINQEIEDLTGLLAIL